MRIPYEEAPPLGREFIDLGADVSAAILRTLAAGWRYAICFKDISPQTCEILMTERLRDGMRHELKKKCHPWGRMLMVLPGTESRSNSDVLNPDGRTDIPIMLIEIFLTMQEHDPHAIIECKRIAGSDTHLCREYVKEGIDRFSTGKYGFNHAVGFMVGYLLVGDGQEAAAGINAHLRRKKRETEFLESVDICEDVETWASRHPRAEPSSLIQMFHVFLGLPDSMEIASDSS